MSITNSAIATIILASIARSASANGDPDAGKRLFEEQCAACHTAALNDAGGSQGPSLIGLFGRRAGDDKAFDYSKPLRDSALTWDAISLDRFLAAPDRVVPGTAMVIAVPNAQDRMHLIAYFKRLATPATETTSKASISRGNDQ